MSIRSSVSHCLTNPCWWKMKKKRWQNCLIISKYSFFPKNKNVFLYKEKEKHNIVKINKEPIKLWFSDHERQTLRELNAVSYIKWKSASPSNLGLQSIVLFLKVFKMGEKICKELLLFFLHGLKNSYFFFLDPSPFFAELF